MPADDEFLYHITSKTVARIVKEKGLRSGLLRLGVAVAAGTGSFVRDRKEQESAKGTARLAGYLAELIGSGATEDTIQAKPGVYVAFPFMTTGNNDDFVRLTPLERSALQQYRLAHGNLVASDRQKTLAAKARAKVLAAKLMGNKVHALTRLAVQVTSWTYNIEETITASHVYFLTPRYAADGYRDYTKGMNVDSIVVLRAAKASITGLVQDEADHRALRTKDAVPPDKFALIATPTRFSESPYRCDGGSWSALANWGG